METAMQLQSVRNNNLHPTVQILNPINKDTALPKKAKKRSPFIEANTKDVDIPHLKNECVVPVFSKDNEITISHPAFIETVWEASNLFFKGETFDEPDIRVSLSRSAGLPPLSPLRTVRAGFLAYGSSVTKFNSHKIKPVRWLLQAKVR